MKKPIIFILSCVLISFVSCTKADMDDTLSKKYCWEFTMTTKCSGSSNNSTKVEKCDLTEKQAEEIRKSFESKATTGGYTCTSTGTKKKLD